MDVKLITIDRIGLSNRSVNALHRGGIFTVGEMLECTTDYLSTIRNLGSRSIKEITKKIEEYKSIDETDAWSEGCTSDGLNAPEDFNTWIREEENRRRFLDCLKEKKIRLESIELLSARAFNLLMFAGYDYLDQIAFFSEEELLAINRMDPSTASEIVKLTQRYIKEIKDDILKELLKENAENEPLSLYTIISSEKYRHDILQYVRSNDLDIDKMGLTNRSRNCLMKKGYSKFSDIVLMSESDLMSIPAMGSSSVNEIMKRINGYFTEHGSKIVAFIKGDKTALYDDESIRNNILKMFTGIGFNGLSLNEISKKLVLPEENADERIKHVLGKMIASGELEYVDYRCYRVYEKFTDVLGKSTCIDDRSREFINRRLHGSTLESIGQDFDLTRERVRQIVKKDIQKIRDQYELNTGMSYFDEDYYRYLYETYAFDKDDAKEWFGISEYVWRYFELNDVKHGSKDLQLALEDHQELEAGLRLKIRNYLNRNKLFIDGMWIDRKRAELEQVVVRKFCTDSVSFDEFCKLYNEFLENEEILFDPALYITEDVYRTRQNHISGARFVLWKQFGQMRYYDIDGRDYTELLDTLNLDSYENIEISTAKFMRDYPEVMKRYDIRDQYELHNLLRKIVPEGEYHDFHCGRMPEIRFGTFDLDSVILDILIEKAPISMNDLADIISQEYGYDTTVVKANYLKSFAEYYHDGIYDINQKPMSSENKAILKNELTAAFYYLDEIRDMYERLVPGADPEEINPYNLSSLGFKVFSRCAVKDQASLHDYFMELLTSEDIVDIRPYRKRFVYIQDFSYILMKLKRDLQVIEFEPDQIINFRKLEESGVTREMVMDFCDSVYDFVEDDTYFSAQYLKQNGFESELYDLGFSDLFYANLLLSDDRFSFGKLYNNLILYKGPESITIKSFVVDRINEHGCIDTFDLIDELAGLYGCDVTSKWDVLKKIQDTKVYYDKTLDRFYANKDLYDNEVEEGFML